MATRDVREIILDTVEGRLRDLGVRHAYAEACAIVAIVEGQGIKLVRPAHHHDPNADWHRQPDAPPAGQAAKEAARAVLRGATTSHASGFSTDNKAHLGANTGPDDKRTL
jgi:hypothetical protein